MEYIGGLSWSTLKGYHGVHWGLFSSLEGYHNAMRGAIQSTLGVAPYSRGLFGAHWRAISEYLGGVQYTGGLS